jgi:hypothetical protein
MISRFTGKEDAMMKPKKLYVVTDLADNYLSNAILQGIHEEAKRLYHGRIPDDKTRIIFLTKDQWQLGKSFVPPEQKVLFVGSSRFIREMGQKVPVKFHHFGITYGWNRSRACLSANEFGFTSYREYRIFLKLLEKEELTAKMAKQKSLDVKQMLAMAAVAVFVPFGTVLVGGKLAKDWYTHAEAMRRQQYVYGVFQFYKRDLKRFMDEPADREHIQAK